MLESWTSGVRWLLLTAFAVVASVVFCVSPASAGSSHMGAAKDFAYDAACDDGLSREFDTATRFAATSSEEIAATAADEPSGYNYDPSRSFVAPSGARVFEFRRASVNSRGTDLVESHLLRFADDGVLDPAEAGMLDRRWRISSGDLVATDYDLAFYTHELRELTLYRQAGYPTGQPSSGAYEFWDELHTQALSDYGFTRAQGLDVLYHPSVR
jgi:hypothetical protein